MAIRKLYGTGTAGGHVFWTDVAESRGWRVQYNRTLDSLSPLKPFRLLDPRDHLWASADSAEELADALPSLIDEFSAKTPLLSDEDVKSLLKTGLALALQAFAKRKRD